MYQTGTHGSVGGRLARPIASLLPDRNFIDFCPQLWDTVPSPSAEGLGAARRQAVCHTTREGGEVMPITLTFHVLNWTITIRVKSRNRHSAK